LKKFGLLFISLIFVNLLIGCNQEKVPGNKAKVKKLKNTFSISGAWIRPAAKNMNSACYFEVVNNTSKPDTLLGAESDLAKTVQIHETFNSGKDMMGMKHVKVVPVKANSTVQFKPSGYHVMLIGLNEDLKPGDTERVTLKFKNRGKVVIIAKVKNNR